MYFQQIEFEALSSKQSCELQSLPSMHSLFLTNSFLTPPNPYLGFLMELYEASEMSQERLPDIDFAIHLSDRCGKRCGRLCGRQVWETVWVMQDIAFYSLMHVSPPYSLMQVSPPYPDL